MSVSIFLIRNIAHDSAANTDDCITIRRKDDGVLVTYRDRQNGMSTKQELSLSRTGLSRYIQNLGYLFLTDHEPFKQIQFNFPGFPSFMATQTSMKDVDTQNALMDIAEVVTESWFSEPDEYADMPPLVPTYPQVRPLPTYNYGDEYTGHY